MKQPEKKKYTWILPGLYAVTFLFVGYIMYNAPLVTDDYLFLGNGSDTFRKAWLESLHYGNGRFLGNLTTIFLLRHPIALLLEKGLITVGIFGITAKLIAGKDRAKEVIYFLMVSVLMLGVSASIFSEVISWTSGFQNYVPGIFAALVCTAAFLHESEKKASKIADFVWIIVFGVTGQLYLELNTMMNLLIVGVLVIVCAVKKKDQLTKSLVWFASLLIGALLMFFIPKVFEASTDLVETYRKLHIHGLGDMIGNIYDNASQTVFGFFGCRIFMAMLCAVALIMLKKQESSFKSRFVLSACRLGLIGSTAFSVGYDLFASRTSLTKVYTVYMLLAFAAFAVFVLCVLITLFHMPKGIEKTMCLCSVAAAVAVLAPMMLVKPFGPRCLFLSYYFLSACILFMTKSLLRQAQPMAVCRITQIGLGVLAALMACLGIVFTDVGWMSRQQVAYIEAKVQEHPKVIEAINLPTDYVRTPCIWALNRVYYNEKQFDIEFVYLDFDEWYANRQAEGWY